MWAWCLRTSALTYQRNQSVPAKKFTGTLYFVRRWARGRASGAAASCCYLLTTTIAKEPGFILPRRSPGAGASNSADGRNTL